MLLSWAAILYTLSHLILTKTLCYGYHDSFTEMRKI